MPLSVIIIGSNSATKLGLIRSIGEEIGCNITVINMVKNIPQKKAKPVDCSSKYVKRCYYAQKYNPESLYFTLINNCIEKEFKAIIFSVDDDSTYLIDLLQDKLFPYFEYANINHQSGQIALLMNKQVQKQIAQDAGFKVAKSWVVDFNNGSFVVPENITYPCYVKGLYSYHTLKKHQGKCHSNLELESKLREISAVSSYPVIVEEFINVNKDIGVIGFSDGHKCSVPGVVELLDSGHGNHKGVSAFGLVRKQRDSEDVLDKVRHIVDSISLFGLFNVDLVESNGELFFVELNLRFAAYGYAVSRAGANLPMLMVKHCMGGEFQFDVNIEKDCFYFNELVCMDDVLGGYRTIKEYKQLKAKATFGIMEGIDDPTPFSIYKIRLARNHVKLIIKKLMRNEK